MNRWVIEYYDNLWYRRGSKVKRGSWTAKDSVDRVEAADTFETLAEAQKAKVARLVRRYVEVVVTMQETGNAV